MQTHGVRHLKKKHEKWMQRSFKMHKMKEKNPDSFNSLF